MTKPFVAADGLYFVVTTVYSSHLKRVPLLDALFCRALYAAPDRGAHGDGMLFGVAADVSMFIFLSLALMKTLS